MGSVPVGRAGWLGAGGSRGESVVVSGERTALQLHHEFDAVGWLKDASGPCLD